MKKILLLLALLPALAFGQDGTTTDLDATTSVLADSSWVTATVTDTLYFINGTDTMTISKGVASGVISSEDILQLEVGTLVFMKDIGGTTWFSGRETQLILSSTDITLSGTLNVTGGWKDGVKQTFNPDGTNAGVNLGSQAGDPSSTANGDVWYDSSTEKFRTKENGVNVDVVGGGGSADSTFVTVSVDSLLLGGGVQTITSDADGIIYVAASGDDHTFKVVGSTKLIIGSSNVVFTVAMQSSNAFGGRLASSGSSLTSPYATRQNDTNSGLGGDGADKIAMISGAKSAIVTSSNGTATNVELFGSAALFGASIAGEGVLRLNDVTTAPTGTMTSGGLLYVQGTALAFLADDGTLTTLTESTPLLVAHTKTNPTNADDEAIFFTKSAITITQMNAVLLGSSTPSVTWTIRHNSDRNATGAEVVTGGTTTTSTTVGSFVTSFNDATIPGGSWVWYETTAQSGTVGEICISLTYSND